MQPQAAIEAIEAIRKTVAEADQAELDAMLAARFGALVAASGSVSVEGAGLTCKSTSVTSETEAPGTPSDSVPEAADTKPAVDALASLSPERRERALALRAAMAEKFGLTPEDFSAVAVGEGETRKVFMMLTAGKGLYKGACDTLMAKGRAKDFEVEVDGQKIDTLKNTTWALYQAFIADAKARGINPLPDSQALAEQNGQPRAGTWLTGEPAVGLYTSCGGVLEGRPYRYWNFRDDGWDDPHVRPAAEV